MCAGSAEIGGRVGPGFHKAHGPVLRKARFDRSIRASSVRDLAALRMNSGHSLST